jgi:hypothetical protein
MPSSSFSIRLTLATFAIASLACASGMWLPANPAATPAEQPTLSIPPTVLSNPVTDPAFAPYQSQFALQVGSRRLQPDQLDIYGLVTNQSQQAFQNLQITIRLQATDGTILQVINTPIALALLAPQESSPFQLNIPDAPAAAVQIDAEVSTGQPVATLVRPNLAVTQAQLSQFADGGLYLTASLTNNSNQAVQLLGVAASAQTDASDGSKILLASSQNGLAASYLQPQETTPVRVLLPAPPKAVNFTALHTQLWFDARPTTALTTPTVQLSKPTAYIDGQKHFHLLGDVTNTGTQALTVRLLASVKNSAGKLLDVSATDTALLAIPAGATIPFDLTDWTRLHADGTLLAQIKDYELLVDWGLSFPTNQNWVDLAIASNSNALQAGIASYSGELRNDTPFNIRAATVIVGFRATNGQLQGMGFQHMVGPLPPGGTLPYLVQIPFNAAVDFASAQPFIILKGEPAQ